MEEIMQSTSKDKQLFYKLINKQRSTTSGTQVTLKYNGEHISDNHEVCGAWEQHFGSLVKASDDSDDTHTMATEIKLIEKHLSGISALTDYTPTIGEQPSVV